MKKFFGWFFIIIGILNIIISFIMIKQGVFGSGSQNPAGKLFFGIGFTGLGIWMVTSIKKKAQKVEVHNKVEGDNSAGNNVITTTDELKTNDIAQGKNEGSSINQQFVKTLFSPETLEIVTEQFKSKTEIIPIDAFNISFRLLRTESNTINLEYLSVSNTGLRYFKPVGFYKKDLTISVLNEYQDDLSKLKEHGDIPTRIIVNSSNLKSEAVVAAFSMETIMQAMEIFKDFEQRGWGDEIIDGIAIPGYMKYDRKYYANGFACELIFTPEGYPQFFLDDKYGLHGPIGAYLKKQNGNLGINPIVEYKGLFDELLEKRLLTAYKKL